MVDLTARQRQYARFALAGIRLLNGALALAAPGFLARRLGVDPKANPALLYVFRMFGMRTILVGLDLLRRDGDPIGDNARRLAPLVHASDASAALIAAFSGLPPRSGITTVLISSLNTALALIQRPRQP